MQPSANLVNANINMLVHWKPEIFIISFGQTKDFFPPFFQGVNIAISGIKGLLNHFLEILRDQALRHISEQVATTRAELGFPGMADKTPFPTPPQAPSVPLSQHQAHTTDIPLAAPKLSEASDAVQTRQTVNTTPGTS